jgi:hypothetical protein
MKFLVYILTLMIGFVCYAEGGPTKETADQLNNFDMPEQKDKVLSATIMPGINPQVVTENTNTDTNCKTCNTKNIVDDLISIDTKALFDLSGKYNSNGSRSSTIKPTK